MLPLREEGISWAITGRRLPAVSFHLESLDEKSVGAETVRRPLPSSQDPVCPVAKRRPGALHQLHSLEEGVQLLSR